MAWPTLACDASTRLRLIEHGSRPRWVEFAVAARHRVRVAGVLDKYVVHIAPTAPREGAEEIPVRSPSKMPSCWFSCQLQPPLRPALQCTRGPESGYHGMACFTPHCAAHSSHRSAQQRTANIGAPHASVIDNPRVPDFRPSFCLAQRLPHFIRISWPAHDSVRTSRPAFGHSDGYDIHCHEQR